MKTAVLTCRLTQVLSPFWSGNLGSIPRWLLLRRIWLFTCWWSDGISWRRKSFISLTELLQDNVCSCLFLEVGCVKGGGGVTFCTHDADDFFPKPPNVASLTERPQKDLRCHVQPSVSFTKIWAPGTIIPYREGGGGKNGPDSGINRTKLPADGGTSWPANSSAPVVCHDRCWAELEKKQKR